MPLTRKIRRDGVPALPWKVIDLNGNTVGEARLEEPRG